MSLRVLAILLATAPLAAQPVAQRSTDPAEAVPASLASRPSADEVIARRDVRIGAGPVVVGAGDAVHPEVGASMTVQSRYLGALSAQVGGSFTQMGPGESVGSVHLGLGGVSGGDGARAWAMLLAALQAENGQESPAFGFSAGGHTRPRSGFSAFVELRLLASDLRAKDSSPSGAGTARVGLNYTL